MYTNEPATLSPYTVGVPLDGTPIKTVHTFHVKLVVIFDILAIAGILFGFVCLLFNIIFRKRRYVRLHSKHCYPISDVFRGWGTYGSPLPDISGFSKHTQNLLKYIGTCPIHSPKPPVIDMSMQ